MLTDGPHRPEISQHTQVFGVLTGTLTAEEGRRNLLASVEDTSITQCTVAMAFYLFRALEKTGLYEYTNRYWNIWRAMVANGCTTCVEAEDYARSECHAWGALALYELPSVTLRRAPGAGLYDERVRNGTHAEGRYPRRVGEVRRSDESVRRLRSSAAEFDNYIIIKIKMTK